VDPAKAPKMPAAAYIPPHCHLTACARAWLARPAPALAATQTLDKVLASPNATDWFYCPIKDGAEP